MTVLSEDSTLRQPTSSDLPPSRPVESQTRRGEDSPPRADQAIFIPTPDQAHLVLTDLDDPSLSFDALAKKHGTTTDALALWLSTDPVKDQIQTTLDAMSLRVRRLATSRLPAAVAAISRIVDSYGDLRRRDLSERSSADPASPAYLADLERRRRRDESVRRAAALLLRLANFFSPLERPPPRAPRSPGQRSAVAERSVEVADPPGRTWRDDEGSGSNPVPRHDPATAPVPVSMSTVHCQLSTVPTTPTSSFSSSPSPLPSSTSSSTPGPRPLNSYTDGDDLYESLLAPDGTIDPARLVALKAQFFTELNITDDNQTLLAAFASLAPSSVGPGP